MQKFRFFIAVFSLIIFQNLAFTKHSYAAFRPLDEKSCLIAKQTPQYVLDAVKQKDPDVIKSLSTCIKDNYKLIFQVCLIDPSQLANADKIFRTDENFIYRLVKINPEILKYIDDELKSDTHFIEQATYLSREALQYANPKLLDSKPFMQRMITFDSQNYIYASSRVKEMKDVAAKAFEDDGMLLMYAPFSIRDNIDLVKIALNSNSSAFEYVSDHLKRDPAIIKYSSQKNDVLNKTELGNFITKNYLTEERQRNIGLIIDKNTKFFKKNRLISRNYITKWQRNFEFNGSFLEENLHLITAESRNSPNRWRDDLKKYPSLINKINNFFVNRHIDRDTIDNLSLTYLWKVKENPLTLAFNLYLVRDSDDDELGSDYVSVTSLTAIVQQIKKDEWRLSVVEVIFDKEIKADVAYKNGLKRFILQDLYEINKADKNPKLIFRIEDKFKEYFEIYAEQKNGKYKNIYSFDPLKSKD